MFPRTLVVSLILSLALARACRADLIFGAPAGGPVTLHDGSFSIDVDADGAADVTITDRPQISTAGLTGCSIGAFEELGIGAYRGSGFGFLAIALSSGQQVGPSSGLNFLYSVPGLLEIAMIRTYGPNPTDGAGDPTWTDGRHHFLGLDKLSGTDHHYGWVELSLSDSGAPTVGQPWYDATIYGWAYETQPNVPVTIPEPSTAGVLGMIAAGLCLTRRKRKPC